jgi:hypothetical protein
MVDASLEMDTDFPNLSSLVPLSANSRVVCVHDEDNINDVLVKTNAAPASRPLVSSSPYAPTNRSIFFEVGLALLDGPAR